MPTTREIAQLVTWNEVKKSIKKLYPKDKNDYTSAFEFLKKTKKKEQEHKAEFIEIFVRKGWQEPYDSFDDYYSIHTNVYSFSFRPWEELANIPIGGDTLDHYTLPDILAHFIWEMTYHGTQAQAKKKYRQLIKRAKSIK